MIGEVLDNRYKLEKKIGQGAYGTVFKAEDINNKNDYYAIKQISKLIIDSNNYLKNAFQREMDIMYLMNHENSVKLYKNFETKENYNFVMELCDTDLDLELKSHIKKYNKPFNELELYMIMNQFNKILKKMQDEKVIHRDLKLKNIMIKYDKNIEIIGFVIKLSDFGFSKVMSDGDLTGTQLGTPATRAPEIMLCEEYNSKADLWSVGVIIYQLLFNRLPFPARNQTELQRNIMKSNGVKLPENNNNPITETCLDLLDKLLQKTPSKRIEFKDYFNHKFFSKEHKDLLKKNIKENPTIITDNVDKDNIKDNINKNKNIKNEIKIEIIEITDFDKRFIKLILIKEYNGYKLYKAKDKKNNKNVYIKELSKSIINNNDKNKKIFDKEIELLSTLKGKQFPEFIGLTKTDSNYYIIIEYFSGNNFDDFIHRHHKKLTKSFLDSIYYQLKSSFLKIKEKNINLDNISSKNFAFSFYQNEYNFEIKFFDYGLNSIFENVNKSKFFKIEDLINFDTEKNKPNNIFYKNDPIIKDEEIENIIEIIKNKLNFIINYFDKLFEDKENILYNEIYLSYFNEIITLLYFCALECRAVIKFLKIDADMDISQIDETNYEINFLKLYSKNKYDYSYINLIKEYKNNKSYLYNKENPSFKFFLNIFKNFSNKIDDIFYKLLEYNNNNFFNEINFNELNNNMNDVISIYEDESLIIDNKSYNKFVEKSLKEGNIDKLLMKFFENGRILYVLEKKNKAFEELIISRYLIEYIIFLRIIFGNINNNINFDKICQINENNLLLITFIGGKLKLFKEKGTLEYNININGTNLSDNELKDENNKIIDKMINFYQKILQLIDSIKTNNIK